MANLKPGVEDEKKYVMASLYTSSKMAYGLKKSKFNPIMINSSDLYWEESWIELHVHRADENDPNAIAVSPNNASVLLDLSCPIIPFYSIAIKLNEKKRTVKMLVTHHWVIDDCIPINKGLADIFGHLRHDQNCVDNDNLPKNEELAFMKKDKVNSNSINEHESLVTRLLQMNTHFLEAHNRSKSIVLAGIESKCISKLNPSIKNCQINRWISPIVQLLKWFMKRNVRHLKTCGNT